MRQCRSCRSSKPVQIISIPSTQCNTFGAYARPCRRSFGGSQLLFKVVDERSETRGVSMRTVREAWGLEVVCGLRKCGGGTWQMSIGLRHSAIIRTVRRANSPKLEGSQCMSNLLASNVSELVRRRLSRIAILDRAFCCR